MDPGTDAVPRVLLIEPHLMFRQLLAERLRSTLGFRLVGECRTVQESTAACLRETPDLVMLDWYLPDGRASDVVRECGPSLPRTRWLFVSTDERSHMVREAIALGVHGVVLKRSSLSVLKLAIDTVLAGQAYYCEDSSRLLVESLRNEAETVGCNLTNREREVLRRYARGENNKLMAQRLGVSTKTVHNLLAQIKEKIGESEPAGLVRYAIRHGYTEVP